MPQRCSDVASSSVAWPRCELQRSSEMKSRIERSYACSSFQHYWCCRRLFYTRRNQALPALSLATSTRCGGKNPWVWCFDEGRIRMSAVGCAEYAATAAMCSPGYATIFFLLEAPYTCFLASVYLLLFYLQAAYGKIFVYSIAAGNAASTNFLIQSVRMTFKMQHREEKTTRVRTQNCYTALCVFALQRCSNWKKLCWLRFVQKTGNLFLLPLVGVILI